MSHDTSQLISAARSGNSAALSLLIDQHRPYLKLLARIQQDDRLRSKLDDSDLVQEVSTEAFQDFAKFVGGSEGEFACWLRTKMAGVAAKSLRHYMTQQRDVHLERSLNESFDRSSSRIVECIAGGQSSPISQVLRRERSVLIAQALDALPEHYRDVLIMRELQNQSLDQVARKLGGSPERVRKIWARAIVKIRRMLKDVE
jgi:RNA polymerase sigma-70 factor (ECF subfamily)